MLPTLIQALKPRLPLMLVVAGVCSVLTCVDVTSGRAAAPLANTPAPGFFRISVGDFEVTALSDGVASLDVVKLLNEPAQETEAALKESFLHNPLDTSVNAYLINTGRKLILVDAGSGAIFGPALGKLRANLQAAGYRPEQVDDILLTHMHRDHIGGLAINGKAAFPNATVHVDRRESDFWRSKASLDKAPPDARSRFLDVAAALAPYMEADHYRTFETDSEILPGVRSMASYGHTVGHTTYVIQSTGQQLWLTGDVVNVAAVQLQNPSVSIFFDLDGRAASATRMRVLTSAAEQGVLLGGAHLPFPGLGHVRPAQSGWQWVPLDASTAMH